MSEIETSGREERITIQSEREIVLACIDCVERLQADYDATIEMLLKESEGRASNIPAFGTWTRVEDGLPEQPPDFFEDGRWRMVPVKSYIVADSEGRAYMAHKSFGCTNMDYFWYRDSLTPLRNITHWMPLPEGPGTEEDDD